MPFVFIFKALLPSVSVTWPDNRSLGPITQNSQSVKNNLYPKLHFKYVLTRGLVAYGIAVESRKKSASDRKQ